MALALLARPAGSQTPIYHAQVVVEEGAAPATSPQIIPERTTNCTIGNFFGNGTVEYTVSTESRSDECPVSIRLAGYRKTGTTLRDGGVVVLKRPGSYSNPTVSLTTLAAPAEARKAFEKGVAALSANKWATAQTALERAVASYPEYAPAWSALGEALAEQSQPQQARAAWERAVEADPKFARAWAELARLAADQGRMEDVLQAAGRALQLDAAGFPAVYVAQAMANLGLKRLDAAEKSGRRAIEVDTYHEIPRAESVLGSVLAEKGDRTGAIEHWRKYLKLAPKGEDAAEVTRRIAQLGAGGDKAQ
jgi:tetratricopeptide (TPR) repeat protein